MKYENEYPEDVKNLLDNTYVDDILAGSNSIAKLEIFKQNAIRIMGEAQMKLHKWKSNDKSLEKQTVDQRPIYGGLSYIRGSGQQHPG